MSRWGEDDHGGLDDIFVPRDATGDPEPTGALPESGSTDSTTIVLEGREWELIPYGSELIDGEDPFAVPCHICVAKPGARHRRGCAMGSRMPHRRPNRCRDCGAAIGAIHRGDCTIERCPCCGGQLSSFECEGDPDVTLDSD